MGAGRRAGPPAAVCSHETRAGESRGAGDRDVEPRDRGGAAHGVPAAAWFLKIYFYLPLKIFFFCSEVLTF